MRRDFTGHCLKDCTASRSKLSAWYRLVTHVNILHIPKPPTKFENVVGKNVDARSNIAAVLRARLALIYATSAGHRFQHDYI